MALPIENPADKVKAVEEAIKNMGPNDLVALPDLEAEDFKLFGTLIQQFCLMDLNPRRALETFHAAEMLPTDYVKLYPNLPDSKLTEALEAVVEKMDPTSEDIATAVTWIEVIDTTRRQRNLVGHFAGKRFPKHDVYVFVSKSEKDARKVLGFGVAQHEVHTVVAARSEFREMTKSSKSALDWLAKKVLEWNGRYLKVSPLLNPEWVDFVHQDAWCCC